MKVKTLRLGGSGLLLVSLFLLSGCGAESAAAPGPYDAASAVEPAVFLDGREVARPLPADFDGRRPLAELLAETGVDVQDWTLVELRADDGRRMPLARPAATWPDQDLLLFRDEDGRSAIGLFRRPDATMPETVLALLAEPTLRFVLPASIRVHTSAVPEGAEGASPALVVELDGEVLVRLSLEELAALEATPHTGRGEGDGRRRKGDRAGLSNTWPLADVVASVVPLERVCEVRLFDAAGTEESWPADALRNETAPEALLKANRRGELVFRVASEGRELRGVTRLALRSCP